MLVIIPRIFFRVILPAVLLLSCVIRPSLMSALYGILVLIWPFMPGVNGGLPGSTKGYLITCVAVGLLASLAQLIFHLVLVALPPYGRVVENCTELSMTLQLVGLQRLDIPNAGHAVRLLAPDVAVFIASIVTYVVCFIHGRSARQDQHQLPTSQSLAPDTDGVTTVSIAGTRATGVQQRDYQRSTPICIRLIIKILDLLALILLCAAAVIYPSVISAVYFVAFLFIVTWWAAYRPFSKGCFNGVKFGLLLYCAVHMILLYLYQTYQFQKALKPTSLAARLLGLSPIVNSTCQEFWSMRFVTDQRWPAFANPFILFAFYIYVAFETTCISKVYYGMLNGRRRDQGAFISADDASSIHEELLQSESEESSRRPSAQPREVPTPRRAVPRSQSKDYRRFLSLSSTADQSERTPLDTFIRCIIRNSYALALIMMMAWAITYHSWLSFVWLVLACLVWMLKDTRKACLILSPFFVSYAEALLLLQFIYGLNTTPSELPDDLPGVPLKQIGLIRPIEAACVPLFIKVFYSIPFWITFRLWLHERNYPEDNVQQTAYGTFDSGTSSSRGISNWISSFLVKYWIYVVAIVLLAISIQTPVVAYNVVYMAFFVVLITVLQASFTVWRLMLFLYWMILTAFSIAVLLLVYTYQFSAVPTWWSNWTHWNDQVFLDLGLVEYSAGWLFVKLLTPLSFLTVVILQLKFFHSKFMRLTDFSRRHEPTVTEPILNAGASGSRPGSPTRKRNLVTTTTKCYEAICDLLWRIGELHFGKLVALALMLLAVYEVSAVNFVFVVLVCLMLPCRRLQTLYSVLATIWAALVVLIKMIYQMNFVNVKVTTMLDQNCTNWPNDTAFVDPARWAGFVKLETPRLVATYLEAYIIVFILLAFHAIVKIRQKYHREVLGRPTPARGVIFPEVGRQEADENVVKCFMFLVNYGFYKFGLEITFIMVVINIGIRMDAVAFLYVIWVLLLIAIPRRTLARLWWIFVLFVIIALMIQYAVCVGLPPSSCLQYPWTPAVDQRLSYWLYLPSYSISNQPNPYYLIGDFFILLMASCQLYVFRIETSSQASTFEGGDNAPIPDASKSAVREDGQRVKNPTGNFILAKSYLDYAKTFVFLYSQWITLMVVFAAGVGGISGFAFGYLIAAFTLLWKGNDLYLEPHRKVMMRWYILLFYNVLVILLKVAMEVVGCVYICNLCKSNSWLVQLFSISCLRGPKPICVPASNQNCNVYPEEAEIVYDAICFAFLVFQIRIFSSWYFRHSIAEFRAERILSSRGAYLMNLMIRKEMNKQQVAEDQILENVKRTTKRIRENYLAQMEASGKKHFEATSYAEAKRSGDYYMFNDADDDKMIGGDDTFETEPLAPEISPGADVRRVGPIQLANIAVERDLNIDDIVADAKKQDAELRAQGQSPKAASSATAEEEEEKKDVGALARACNFVRMFLGSILNHLTFTFNRWSRDYRYVAFVLNGEKQRLKERLSNELENEEDFRRVRETIFNNEVTREVQQVHTEADVETAEQEAQKSASEHNVVARFMIATMYLLISHTELLCYLMIVLDQMGNAAVISLPLPFFAFFWGTLYSPRPPKFFWVTLITYTEAMIVIKFIFQFGFWAWNPPSSTSPFWEPRILGIEKKDYYAGYDLALLMFLFFHRYVLKGLGLWKDVPYVADMDTEDVGVSKTRNHDNGPILEELPPSGELEITRNTLESEPNATAGRAETTDADGKKTGQGRMAYCAGFLHFYRRLLHPTFRYIMDLYSFMFLCDLICFLILAFGYSSFGVSKGEQNVMADISSNKVPLPFVLMLITLMILIIIDRALYLRKSVLGKLIFQYLLVTVLHCWIFFGLPAVTDSSVSSNTPAKFFYFVKSVYFLLSAWQIRNSYPSRVQGNLLTKRFGMTNYVCYTIFMAIPFLFELRTLIDWVWVDTSMPLFDYFTMDNMYSYVFRTKCMRKFEKDYPVPRGLPKAILVKYGMGIPILALIIILLWLPLLLFALVNSVGERAMPDHAEFSVAIEGYPPLYAMEAQRTFLQQITEEERKKIETLCYGNRPATDFISEYNTGDIYKAQFRQAANKYWTITSPSRTALMDDLKNDKSAVYINFQWQIRRQPRKNSKTVASSQDGSSSVFLALNDSARSSLLDMLDPNVNGSAVVIPNAFPPFVVVPSLGGVQPAKPILFANPNASKDNNATLSFVGVKLQLIKETNGTSEFWQVTMNKSAWLKNYTMADDGNVEMIMFVDRVFPSVLDAFTSGGIIGLYILVVLAAGRFIRTLVFNTPLDVILSEMPDVDRIVQLCQNVYLVREARDFMMEQDLFAKLVFLFRSPETLIRWTRPKVE